MTLAGLGRIVKTELVQEIAMLQEAVFVTKILLALANPGTLGTTASSSRLSKSVVHINARTMVIVFPWHVSVSLAGLESGVTSRCAKIIATSTCHTVFATRQKYANAWMALGDYFAKKFFAKKDVLSPKDSVTRALGCASVLQATRAKCARNSIQHNFTLALAMGAQMPTVLVSAMRGGWASVVK